MSQPAIKHPLGNHRIHRTGWLRAAVMGANDGVVSTASLLLGVAASGADRSEILVAGVAGLVAGAVSMAAGEYVSVSSQADTERAEVELERLHLAHDGEFELDELAAIYRARGLDPELASKVAEQLMAHNALDAHSRDELGITGTGAAHPVQAALTSAITFAAGAALPLLSVLAASASQLQVIVTSTSLCALAGLGALAARAGGASPVRGALRVVLWSAGAMALTWAIGKLLGTTIA